MAAAPAPCRPARGYTLVEMLCALAVGAILAAIAFPGYTHVVHKARRSDATVALLQLQLAQERHRADHATYGSLAELRAAERSAAGHYRLVLARADGDGFEAHAWATGAQGGDAACRRLTLRVDGGHAVYASGSDTRTDNADAVNRRCWSL
jgi:type IV pilus assembly protein PilE